MSKRLEIANRISLLLEQELGEGIRAERMVRDRLYARDVLFVCDAIKQPELNNLARQYREAVEARMAPRRAIAPESANWANDSSGFGASEPAKEGEPATEAAGWLGSTWRWLSR